MSLLEVYNFFPKSYFWEKAGEEEQKEEQGWLSLKIAFLKAPQCDYYRLFHKLVDGSPWLKSTKHNNFCFLCSEDSFMYAYLKKIPRIPQPALPNSLNIN